MAPEIIEMQQQSPACDIWSLGCTVIELFTGKPPFFDLNPMAALYRIVTDEMPLPSDVSPALKGFLEECFQKDPNRRIKASALINHQWITKNLKPNANDVSSTQGPSKSLALPDRDPTKSSTTYKSVVFKLSDHMANNPDDNEFDDFFDFDQIAGHTDSLNGESSREDAKSSGNFEVWMKLRSLS